MLDVSFPLPELSCYLYKQQPSSIKVSRREGKLEVRDIELTVNDGVGDKLTFWIPANA